MKKQFMVILLILLATIVALSACAPTDTPPADDPDGDQPSDTPETPDGEDEGDSKDNEEEPKEPSGETEAVGASHITFTVGGGTESRYIYENKGGNLDSGGNRYCDLERYFVYRFPVNAAHEVAELRLTIGNQYKVEASADGVAYDVKLSTTDKTPINMVLDLTSYLPAEGDGYVYVRFSDADPTDGWGANVRCSDPVLFFSGSAEDAKSVFAEYQSKLKLTLNGLSAMFTSHTYKAEDGTELLYRLYLPADYDPKQEYPLLVTLHGAGERGNDNESQLRNMLLNLFNLDNSPARGAIVVAPQCPAGQQWVDTPWVNGNYSTQKVAESNELAAVVELIDDLWFEYSVDGNRIYAMGLSMGGFGTWDLLARHSDLFAAGIPICGGGDPEMAEVLAGVPIRTFHGSADPTVPVSGTRAMAEALEAAGSKDFVYEEFKGAEHGIWNTVASRADVIAWLFEQNLADR